MVCRVNIAGHTVLGSKACFPRLTFAYISIRQVQRRALQLFAHRQNSARARRRCLPVTAARAWESRAGARSPPRSSAKASWPCSTLCCFAADTSQEAIFTAQLSLLGNGNPFPIPSQKGGKQSSKLCPLQNLFPGNHLHSHMPGIPLPGSGESSCTLGWAEKLKTTTYHLPYPPIRAAVKDVSLSGS